MANFELNYTGVQVNELLAKADTALQTVPDTYATKDFVTGQGYITNAYHDDTKQDTISDLDTIRQGASAGATALQSVPDTYALKTYVDNHHDNTKQDVITDLATIRTNSDKGATAVQPDSLLEKSTEQWQFTLDDDTIVTKTIVLGA